MPTTNAIRLLFITPFLLLAGCASEFDKCTNTELPKTKKLAGLNAEREAGWQLISLKEHYEKDKISIEAYRAWAEKNPEPSDETEAIRWNERSDEEYLRAYRDQGFPADNMEELNSFFEEYPADEKLSTLVKPRSVIWQCYKDGDCDDYSYKDGYSKVVMRAIPEAMLTNATNITDLTEKSKELATVTCNNNGFYE